MNKKIILMRGLPGSGKSTWAKNLLKEQPNIYKRINRDELRLMFDDGQTSKESEKFIRQVRDTLIWEALRAGKNVIVDDTNLTDHHYEHFRQLIEKYNTAHTDNVQIEIQEMTTPLELCIHRDAQRPKPVGAKVIREMNDKLLKQKAGIYAAQDANLPKALICDLDGTLALLHHRNPYDTGRCETDELNQPVADLLNNYAAQGHKILLVSGRTDQFRAQTLRWLQKHLVPYHALIMRATTDNRRDSVVKRELFEQHIAGRYFIDFVLDDRNQVVDMWRGELQLPCFQVNYGDF
ncbi:phosphatase domain-containing protein [Flexibacter flexilis]|nr:AAA family ATPase [Flexibacter flexilis]